MQQKCVSLADVVLRLGHVIKKGIRTLILVLPDIAHHVQTVILVLLQRNVVVARLPVLVINVNPLRLVLHCLMKQDVVVEQ